MKNKGDLFFKRASKIFIVSILMAMMLIFLIKTQITGFSIESKEGIATSSFLLIIIFFFAMLLILIKIRPKTYKPSQ